jgi:hypothetical protein
MLNTILNLARISANSLLLPIANPLNLLTGLAFHAKIQSYKFKMSASLSILLKPP